MEVSALQRRGAELERAREAAAGQRSLVERHMALASERERHEGQRTELIGMIESLLDRSVSADRQELIAADLRAELDASNRAVVEAGEGIVRARAAFGAAEQALQLLDADQAMCPTCMRPLAQHERDAAVATHNIHQVDAEADAARLQETHRTGEIRSQTIRRLLAQLEALSLPRFGAVDVQLPTLPDADGAYRRASADVDEHNQRLGGVQSRLDVLSRLRVYS